MNRTVLDEILMAGEFWFVVNGMVVDMYTSIFFEKSPNKIPTRVLSCIYMRLLVSG